MNGVLQPLDDLDYKSLDVYYPTLTSIYEVDGGPYPHETRPRVLNKYASSVASSVNSASLFTFSKLINSCKTVDQTQERFAMTFSSSLVLL